MNSEFNRERLEKVAHELMETLRGHQLPQIVANVRTTMAEPMEPARMHASDMVDTLLLEIYLHEVGFDFKTAEKLHQPRVAIRSVCLRQTDLTSRFVRQKILENFEAFRVIPKKKKRA